ncbi:putative glucomannan 4-beta-mannosyltransferase [Helianthus debilis subsp. tardiflorus]
MLVVMVDYNLGLLFHEEFVELCDYDDMCGTGGVWQITAINEACGWKDMTTVEDMDLVVRAGLKGWKFLYLGDLHMLKILSSHGRYWFCKELKCLWMKMENVYEFSYQVSGSSRGLNSSEASNRNPRSDHDSGIIADRTRQDKAVLTRLNRVRTQFG